MNDQAPPPPAAQPAPPAPPPSDAPAPKEGGQKAALLRESGPIHINVDKIDEVAAWMQRARAPEAYNPNVPFTVVPQTMKVMNLEEHMPHPARVRKHMTFTDTNSFLSYFNEFSKQGNTKLFATRNISGVSFLCVFDYDRPGTVNTDEASWQSEEVMPLPQWNEHRCYLGMKYHPDYIDLKCLDGKMMSQQDFALFVEKNTHLFHDPDGATMLEMAQHLKGMTKAQFQSGRRLSNGQVSIEYIEETRAQGAKGELDVPEYITMFTPIFDGFDPEEIRASFRWRIGDDKKITLGFSLLTKVQERRAEEDVRKDLSTSTGLPIMSVDNFGGICATAE